MIHRTCLLILPMIALVAGCASAPAMPDCTPVGRSGYVCLLAPEALPAVRATHMVNIRRDGHEDVFLGQLQINADTLRLAGTSLFGTNLFMVVYDGHTITSEAPQTDIRPKMLVVMLELSVADPAILKSRLHHLTINVNTDNHGQVRELFEHDRLIARIEISNAPLADAQIDIQIPSENLSVRMTPVANGVPQP